MGYTGLGVRQDVLGLALLFAVVPACQPAASTWSPDGGTIVFAFERGEGAGLASCELASGEVRLLFASDEHDRLVPIFDESGERIAVVAVEEGLAPDCEVLSLTPEGEQLARRRLDGPGPPDSWAGATINQYTSFVDGGSLWIAWFAPDPSRDRVCRRFDLDRNELTDDVMRPGCVVLRRGDELISIGSRSPRRAGEVEVSLRSIAASEWPAATVVSVPELADRSANLRGVAVGRSFAALVEQPKSMGASAQDNYELCLIELDSGSLRRLELPALGVSAAGVFGPDERELWLVAAREGVLWLHGVATEDGRIRSWRLMQADLRRTPSDERLAADADLSLSPDGTRLAVSIFSAAQEVGQPDLFVFELGDELKTVGRYNAPR